MNKTQLIDMAAAKSGLTKKDTTAAEYRVPNTGNCDDFGAKSYQSHSLQKLHLY